jgi:hypothetical protein
MSYRNPSWVFWPLFSLSVTGSGRGHSYHQVGRLLDISKTSQQAASLIEPSRPVFHNPIEQGTFKTYIVANLLALDPFVTKDLLAFG